MKKVLALALLVLVATLVGLASSWREPSTTPASTTREPTPTTPRATDAPPAAQDRTVVTTTDPTPSSTTTDPHPLRVRTVDQNGLPVPEARTRLTLTLRQPDGSEQPLPYDLPATDQDGLAYVSAPMHLVRPQHQLLRATVRAMLIGGDGPEVPVDLQTPPTSPIDLMLPACGQLEVTLLDQRGAPWTTPASLRLQVHVRGPDQESRSVRVGVDGRALIPLVRCGTTLVVNAPYLWNTSCTIDGPARAGDTVRAVLQLPATFAVVQGRLLGSNQQPYPNPAEAVLEGQGGSASGLTMATDEDGRFRLVMPGGFLGNFELNSFGVSAIRKPNGDEAENCLHAPLVAGINEVGDVVMATAPLLVGGRVVTATGAAPSGVVLQIERHRPEANAVWAPLLTPPMKLDAEGHFTIHTLTRGCRHRLQVSGACRPQTLDFEPGTADLTVHITSGATMTASFVDDPVIDRLAIRLDPPTTPPVDAPGAMVNQQAQMRGKTTRRDGRVFVDWEGLDPGVYRFVVACPAYGNVLDFAITIGNGKVEDQRLVDIDLRQHARVIAVQVTDSQGNRLPVAATVFLCGGAAPDAWTVQQISKNTNSKVTFPVGQPADVFVVANGYRGRALTAVFADVQVAMEAAPTIHLRCAQVAQLPNDITAKLSWWRVDATHGAPTLAQRSQRKAPGSIDLALLGDGLPKQLVNGTATLRGECTSRLVVDLVLEDSRGRSERLPMLPGVIDCGALWEGQDLELTVDEGSLQHALDGLRAR